MVWVTRCRYFRVPTLPIMHPWSFLYPQWAFQHANTMRFCNAMADYGVNVACFDVRGLGNSSVRVSRSVDFSYATVVEQEYCAALRLVAQEFPKSRLLLVGHSLGGQLGALYTAHAKHHASKGWVIPDGLGLIASCSIYHKGWPFPMSFGLLVFTQFSLMLSKILGYFPGKYVGFGGSEARSLISDWLMVRALGATILFLI